MRSLALAFCKEITAQIAAGTQPISVICKIRQIIQVSILPLKRKDKNGKKIAIKVMEFFLMMVTADKDKPFHSYHLTLVRKI